MLSANSELSFFD